MMWAYIWMFPTTEFIFQKSWECSQEVYDCSQNLEKAYDCRSLVTWCGKCYKSASCWYYIFVRMHKFLCLHRWYRTKILHKEGVEPLGAFYHLNISQYLWARFIYSTVAWAVYSLNTAVKYPVFADDTLLLRSTEQFLQHALYRFFTYCRRNLHWN